MDGGALFFKSRGSSATQLQRTEIMAESIIKSMEKMGYAAAGIAKQDMAAGFEFLLSIQKESSVQLVSANILKKDSGAAYFTSHIIHNAGSLKVAIIGITDHSIKLRASEEKDFIITPWHEVLGNDLKDVEPSADLIILLSSYPYKTNEKIAQQFSNIDIIVQSGHSKRGLIPKKINNTLITQVEGQGKYLGHMSLSIHPDSKWGDSYQGQVQQVQNELDRIDWQLNRLKKRIPEAQQKQNHQFKKLHTIKSELETKIATLNRALINNIDIPNTYSNKFIPLKTSTPEDKSVKAIVEKAKRRANRISQERITKEKKSNEIKEAQIQPYLNGLIGWKRCRQCHPEQTAFWQTTGHARAWSTLIRKKQQFNPDCIGCHVTLSSYKATYAEKEELLSQLPSVLKGVGCEACHGPGLIHADSKGEKPSKAVSKVTCLQCHTAKHDGDFDFNRLVEKITCPSIGATKSQ